MITTSENVKPRKCQLCENLSFNGYPLCMKCTDMKSSCSPEAWDKYCSQKPSSTSPKIKAINFITDLLLAVILKLLSYAFLIMAILSTISAFITPIIFSEYDGDRIFLIHVCITIVALHIWQTSSTKASEITNNLRGSIKRVNPVIQAKTTEQAKIVSTREENRIKLSRAISNTEYFAGKLKRARSTQSILKLTDQAREQIASNAIVLKASQAKMQKVELEAANEQLKSLLESIELKLLDQMQGQ